MEMDYRKRLRDVREDHDLSQADVGKVINKSQQGYSHIENGRAELKIEDLITLCRFYNITADYLIGLSNDERK
ncbi:MAG: helix-turn-helix transcriptional regulator [Clostridia bacterium]|nr:helix-turn-helix transcriptional regulator [Clostridia bacterium]